MADVAPGVITARGNRYVGKAGSMGKGPCGKRHAWEVSHEENSTGKTGLGKSVPGEVSLLPLFAATVCSPRCRQ